MQRKKTRVVAAAVSACALAIGSAAPAMAHGGKQHHKHHDKGGKLVNVQTNVAIINQQAIAVNLGKGTATAVNYANVNQKNS